MEKKELMEAFQPLIDELKAKYEGSEKTMSETIATLKEELKTKGASIEQQNAALEQLKEDLRDVKASQGRVEKQAEQPVTWKAAVAEVMDKQNDDIQKFVRGEKKSLALEIDAKAVGDQSTANITGGSVWGAQYRNGIITNPNQIGHLRSALPVMSAGAGTDFYFMRENGAGEGAPAPTSEKTAAAAATTQATGLKPQFDQDLVESSVKFENIAGYMTVSNKALRNIPNFLQYLNFRIPERLLDVEDAQILYGNGTSPNIKGILTSGNFTAGSAAGTTPLVEKILNDISALEDTHKRSAAAIWMRPADYWSFFKNKAGGSEEYDLPQGVTFVGNQLLLWGIPVFKTTALTANDYVIGAAGGAEIQQQSAIAIEFFDQDGTNVRTNQVTIRVEETIALPVYGSNYFVKGSSALA